MPNKYRYVDQTEIHLHDFTHTIPTPSTFLPRCYQLIRMNESVQTHTNPLQYYIIPCENEYIM